MEKPTVHELKCWPAYFAAVCDGRKTFELRLNDQGFKVGDVLWLREYVMHQQVGPRVLLEEPYYTGRHQSVVVTYMLDQEDLEAVLNLDTSITPFVILGIKLI